MTPNRRPIGYFVHHQGRGHAERCAAIVNALPSDRPVAIFCARDDIFPQLPSHVEIVRIPSLFEPRGTENCTDRTDLPDTLHCAPIGWSGIREAMGMLADWFRRTDPVLMICDVSAEIAQLSRICSVPHVKVLQHGRRDDPGHRAAYDGAVGLIAPCDVRLAQPEWTPRMRAKTCFAGGLGLDCTLSDRGTARAQLGISPQDHVVLVMSGGGGNGTGSAALGVGARALPDSRWITIGHVARDWHATEPQNLRHDGWVDNAGLYLAAADLIVASTGNTTCHEILASGTPWLAVPEWRYFDEQIAKADALSRAGAAHVVASLPSSVPGWRAALRKTVETHDPHIQRTLVRSDADRHVAKWLEDVIARTWPAADKPRVAAVPIAAQ